MQLQAERGYLILACNTDTTDYVKCASVLAESIRDVEPRASICLLTDKPVSAPVFDCVTMLPFGDQAPNSQWKLANDWQAFFASPYRQTIKLESDMVLPRNIHHWFDACQIQDVVVSRGCWTFHGHPARDRSYRKIFDHNLLPDVYNAVTYWRRSALAMEFATMVRDIFANWQDCMTQLKWGADQPPNTDLAYALAVDMLGEHRLTLPLDFPAMVHMKRHINGLRSEDWTQELVWEISPGSFRINTINQLMPVHYHMKHFASDIGD